MYVTLHLSCAAAVLGAVVVVLFEFLCGNFSVKARLDQFKSVASPTSHTLRCLFWSRPQHILAADCLIAAVSEFSAAGLTHKEELGEEVDPEVERMLARTVDGCSNVSDFWSGGAMHCQASREQ